MPGIIEREYPLSAAVVQKGMFGFCRRTMGGIKPNIGTIIPLILSVRQVLPLFKS